MIRRESLDKVSCHDNRAIGELLADTCPRDDKGFEIVTRSARRCINCLIVIVTISVGISAHERLTAGWRGANSVAATQARRDASGDAELRTSRARCDSEWWVSWEEGRCAGLVRMIDLRRVAHSARERRDAT